MRKFLFSLFAVLLTGSFLYAQVKMNVFAGPQVSTAAYKIRGNKQNTELKPGFQAGTGLKIPFEKKLYFTPCFFYSLKGYKVNFSAPAFPPDSAATNNNTTIHSVEIGFLLQYDFSEDAGHWFIKFGPTLDFTLFGREEFDYTDNNGGGTISRNMKFSFGDYGRYLASAVAQLGYESSKGYFIFAQYTYGLGSMNNADLGPQIAHRVLGISAGAYLRRRK